MRHAFKAGAPRLRSAPGADLRGPGRRLQDEGPLIAAERALSLAPNYSEARDLTEKLRR